MKFKKFIFYTFFALLPFFLLAAPSKDKKTNKMQKVQSKEGDSYRLHINNINLPINNRGIIADVDVPNPYPDGSPQAGGRVDGKVAIYSSGFFMSGYTNGNLWSNAVASASRIEDYLPGNFGGSGISNMFVLKSDDPPFGDAWQEWAEAVEQGAYFYDGDGDGVYNPVDNNGNGVWDPEEDAPDILGDETVWCVYNDGKPSGDRDFSNMEPQGIEIRQTAFAYALQGNLGNVIFLRYSLLNTGAVAEVLDSVYFGVWADPDLGNFEDDLVGADTTLNAGFVYNDGDDSEFGSNPPCFLIDFFQGPWEYTGNPEDEAYNVRGPKLGIDTIKGAKNLPMTSFIHYMQSHPTQGDPDNEEQARNYLLGFNQQGNVVDACNWEFGDVYEINCDEVDTRYMYSGDPVGLTGWLNTDPTDQRQMSNTGPFTLEQDSPVDIVVAYVIGRGENALNSVEVTKEIDELAQIIYSSNFASPAPPPQVNPVVSTTESSITLTWDTAPQVNYSDVDENLGYDMFFESYIVYQYQKNSTSELEDGKSNKKVIAKYDIEDEISAIYTEDSKSLDIFRIYSGGDQLDPVIYGDESRGRLQLTITKDQFTGSPLIKGKPYFFSIVGVGLDKNHIEKMDEEGNWFVPVKTVDVPAISISKEKVINDTKGNVGIVVGSDGNTTFYTGMPTEHVEGISSSEITYSVHDRDLTTTNTYEVGFFADSLSDLYSLFYYVKDVDRDVKIADSIKNYDNEDITHLYDGVTLFVPWVEPEIDSTGFTGDQWFNDINDSTTGAYYIGIDVEEPSKVSTITAKGSNVIAANDMKRVELRFGQTSKAYRYVRDPLRFVWKGVKAGDPDSGFVDVPFQAWVKTDSEEYQLAVGFTETAFPDDTLGMPDGVWYPGNDIKQIKEYIVIFNSPYTNDYNLGQVYTGIDSRGADLGNGYRLKDGEGITDSMKAVAKSPWFDAMYVVGFETEQPRNSFAPTGTFSITPGPFLTNEDLYTYTIQTDQLADDAQSQWDKVNVYPNPLFGTYEGVGYYPGGRYDEPWVTFNNLPNEVTIKIFSLSGVLLRTLYKDDQSSDLQWDLQNENGLRVASGMYIALISNPEFGDKVLKLAIIMPQKQIQRY